MSTHQSFGSAWTADNNGLSRHVTTKPSSWQRSTTNLRLSFAGEGLSRYYQSILSRNTERQRLVTGKYPVLVTVEENPTRKWLSLGRIRKRRRDSASSIGNTATSHMLVNGTSVERSLASYDRFQWLEDEERQELHERYASVSLELLAEIYLPKPGYLQILSSHGAGSSAAALRNADATTRWNRWRRSQEMYQGLESLAREGPHSDSDRLWVTGFSLAGRRGFVKSVDIQNGHISSVNTRSESMTLWPNEVSPVPKDLLQEAKDYGPFDDALLVSDGFLVPGKDRGGLYVVKNPGNPNSEWTICLTDLNRSDRWFYHR